MDTSLSTTMLAIDVLSMSESVLARKFLEFPFTEPGVKGLSSHYCLDTESHIVDDDLDISNLSKKELFALASFLYSKHDKTKFYHVLDKIIKGIVDGSVLEFSLFTWLEPADIYWSAARNDATFAYQNLQNEINKLRTLQVEVGGHVFAPLDESTENLDKIMVSRGFRSLSDITNNDMPFMIHTGLQSGPDFFDRWLESKVLEYARRYVFNSSNNDLGLHTAIKLAIFSELWQTYKNISYEALFSRYEFYVRADLTGVWSKNRSEIICSASGAYADFMANYRVHRKLYG